MEMLDKILSHKRAELKNMGHRYQTSAVAREIASADPVISLRRSLTCNKEVAIIAEIKRCSPSRGRLTDGLSIEQISQTYERAGARAVSVLTETKFFHGSTVDLQTAKKSTRLPILRKDFIIEESQVFESRLIGADAILLIVAILGPQKLADLHMLARQIGLEVLIEVHTPSEVATAVEVNPGMIGINNRDLKTFNVDLETTENLRPMIPAEIACVSESGIKCREDVLRLGNCGVDAVLVGEAIITSSDPHAKIRELSGGIEDQN